MNTISREDVRELELTNRHDEEFQEMEELLCRPSSTFYTTVLSTRGGGTYMRIKHRYHENCIPQNSNACCQPLRATALCRRPPFPPSWLIALVLIANERSVGCSRWCSAALNPSPPRRTLNWARSRGNSAEKWIGRPLAESSLTGRPAGDPRMVWCRLCKR